MDGGAAEVLQNLSRSCQGDVKSLKYSEFVTRFSAELVVTRSRHAVPEPARNS